MNQELYKEIEIEWHPKLPWDENEFDKNNERKVLYQIYCDSHIYGKNVLAYIGKTDRSFKERLTEHEKSYFQFANNVTYSIGTLKSFTDKLEIPESILIANHKPFFNKSHLHTVSSMAMEYKIIILNNGNHGSLKNSCTNYWWVQNK